MAFPNIRKIPKKFLIFPYLETINDGWEDLGEVEQWHDNSGRVPVRSAHALCMVTSHVGREQGETFRFCPKCLVKLAVN